MERKSKNCENCGKKISLSNYTKHYTSCLKKEKKQETKVEQITLNNNGKVNCPFCNKEYSIKGIYTHIWRSHGEGKNHNPNIGYELGKRTIWNKGLTKETDERIQNYSKKISEVKKEKRTIVSSETRKKLSENAKRIGLGGHTSKYGIYYKCKSGKTVYLQSSFEVKVAKNLDKNNINWTRPKPIIWVDENNIEHLYYPDFYLFDYNVYLDPKNDYLIKKDANKINKVQQQNDITVLILNKRQLEWNTIESLINSISKTNNNLKVYANKVVLKCKSCSNKVNPFTKFQLCRDCYKEHSKKQYFCKSCKNPMKRKTKTHLCLDCYKENNINKKEHNISKSELIKLILNKPFTKIGKDFGISDNAVRKWCKSENLPYRKKDIEEMRSELEKEIHRNEI